MPGQRPPTAGRARPEQGPHRPPVLEWVVAALGVLLVCGAIAYLLFHALARDGAPPEVRLVAERVVELPESWLVQFQAFNAGQEPAARVEIEGTLDAPSGPIETSEATFDHLPPRSGRKGGLFFSRDPRAFELRLRAKGYAEP